MVQICSTAKIDIKSGPDYVLFWSYLKYGGTAKRVGWQLSNNAYVFAWTIWTWLRRGVVQSLITPVLRQKTDNICSVRFLAGSYITTFFLGSSQTRATPFVIFNHLLAPDDVIFEQANMIVTSPWCFEDLTRFCHLQKWLKLDILWKELGKHS